MKKLLAMLLALMLLTVSVACAESANITTLTDPVITVISGGETTTLDLNGLAVTLAFGLPADVPTIQVEATNDSGALVNGVVQLVDGKMLIDVDGLSRPLAADISAAGPEAEEGIKTLFAALGDVVDVKLPAFTGITIPKVDLISLAGLVGAEPTVGADGVQSATFEVPYEMVKSLLSMVGEYRSMVPDAAQSTVGVVFDLIDQLVATDSGFALKGEISDTGANSGLVLDIYPVDGGVTADAAAAALVLSFAENQATIAVDVYTDGDAMTLGEIAVTSDPAAAELDFSLDIMGQMGITGSLYPQDGAQVAALEINALGTVIRMSLTYGDLADGDFIDLVIDAPNMFNAEIYNQSAPAEDGSVNGTISVFANTSGENATSFSFDSKVRAYIGDIQFKAVENAANAIDLENISDAESEQLQEELGNAFGKLMGYIGSLQPAA